MPLSLDNLFNKTLLTVSIESTSIRLMAAEGRRVRAWLNMPFNPRMVSNGQVEDPSGLSTVIKNALTRLGVKLGTVVAAFPSSRITSRVMTLPDVRGMNPKIVLPREARRTMGSAADYNYLFWVPLGKVGLEQRYYLLAAPKSELASFLQTLALSGLRPKKVDSRALALTRGVGVNSTFILNLESGGFDIMVVMDYVPMVITHRELPLGQGVGDLIEEIVDEFQSCTEYYSERNPAAPIPRNTPVFLTGGHPQVNPDFAFTLRESLGRELFFPNPPIEYPQDFPLVQYMVNVGLALKLP